MERVEHTFFISTPQGCNQQAFGTVPGNPVYNGFRRQQLKTTDDDVAVLLECHDRKWTALKFLCKLRTPEDVQELELNAV